jgi:hypothetical protein
MTLLHFKSLLKHQKLTKTQLLKTRLMLHHPVCAFTTKLILVSYKFKLRIPKEKNTSS